MDNKIHITDLIDGTVRQKHPEPQDRALVPWKKKSRASPIANVMERIARFVSPYIARIRKLHPRKAITAVRDLNVYRKIRERLVRFYIKRTAATTAVKPEKLMVCWQPVPLIIAKVALVAVVSAWLYGFAPLVGKWLKIGFDFFKLEDIYNFEFPKQPFFDAIAGYAILSVIAYYGIWFLYRQLLAFLSVLVINDAEDKVYVVRNAFVRKTLYVFSIADIALVVLRQNLVARLFGIGTISLEKKSGELVEINSVGSAREAVKLLSRTHGKSRESAYDRV